MQKPYSIRQLGISQGVTFYGKLHFKLADRLALPARGTYIARSFVIYSTPCPGKSAYAVDGHVLDSGLSERYVYWISDDPNALSTCSVADRLSYDAGERNTGSYKSK